MVKNRVSILNKIKKTEILDVEEKNVVKVKNVFNYDTFPEHEREELKELEQRATFSGNNLNNNIMELGEVFLKAQKIFSKKGTGVFGDWYEKLSFKKDFVYMCIDRKKLSIEYKDDVVYQLPDKVIKDIKKIKNPKAIKRILKSENIKEAIKEEFKHEVKSIPVKKESSSVITEEVIISKNYIEERILSLLDTVRNNEFSDKKLTEIEEALKSISIKF